MSLLETLRVAWEALLANKMRSVLTMIGIIIGVGSVIAIFAIGRGTSAAVAGELSEIGSGLIFLAPGRPGSRLPTERTEFFTEADLQALQDLLPDVEAAVTSYDTRTTVRYMRTALQGQVQGHTVLGREVFGVKLAAGRWFTEEEVQVGSRVVVLGHGAARELLGEDVNPVGQTITIDGQSFQVIGVTEPPTGFLASLSGAEDKTYYVPITWVERMIGNPPIFMVYLKAREGANSQQVLRDAIALMEIRHNGAPFYGQAFDQFTGTISAVLTIITGVLSAVAGISLVVGGVGIMNIMLVSVTERTREIGIRKAIGATFRDIMVQFLIEAVLLSVIGGAIGVALAAIPVYAVASFLDIAIGLDWMSVTLALGFSVAVGVIFGVYPASKAARLDPIEALRYE